MQWHLILSILYNWIFMACFNICFGHTTCFWTQLIEWGFLWNYNWSKWSSKCYSLYKPWEQQVIHPLVGLKNEKKWWGNSKGGQSLAEFYLHRNPQAHRAARGSRALCSGPWRGYPLFLSCCCSSWFLVVWLFLVSSAHQELNNGNHNL